MLLPLIAGVETAKEEAVIEAAVNEPPGEDVEFHMQTYKLQTYERFKRRITMVKVGEWH